MTSRAAFDVPVTAPAVDFGRTENALRLATAGYGWLWLTVTCADVEVLVNDAGAIPGVGIEEVDGDRWREST